MAVQPGYYSKNVDYTAAIKRAKDAKAPTTYIADLEQERANKISAASPEQLTKWGITPTPTSTPTNTITTPTAVTQPTGKKIGLYTPQGQYFEVDEVGLQDALKDGNTYGKPIGDMYDEQKVSAAAAIRQARDTAISGYNQQISDAPGIYKPLRNASSVGGAVRAKGIKEAMAASGQGNSGANLTAGVQNNAQTTGEIAGYNMQQADLVNKLKRAIADTTNSASMEELRSNADINAQKIQATISEANRAEEMNYRRSQDAFGNNLNLAQITGAYNGTPTLQAQNQQFNQNLNTQQFGLQQKQQNFDNLYRQQVFNYQKSRDTVADSQWQKSMNLNLRQQSFNEAQQSIQNALAERRISQDDASQAFQWAKFNAEQDPNSIDNQLKRQGLDINAQSKNDAAFNTIIDNYNKVYINQTYDPMTGGNTITINKKGVLDSLKASVQSKSMTEQYAKQVAAYYGISL
jgi:hypothetical protein